MIGTMGQPKNVFADIVRWQRDSKLDLLNDLEYKNVWMN